MCLSKGELAISSEMEKLQTALFFDNVPDTWTKLAYPSTYSLAIWCVCVCCYLFFVSRRLTYVVQRCFSFSLCVSGIMMCCSAVRSWTAGLRTSLCRVLSGCLDFSTHSPSSLVTHIHACSPRRKSFKILIIYLLHHHSSTLTLQQ